jgi:hypothetical protein
MGNVLVIGCSPEARADAKSGDQQGVLKHGHAIAG